MLEIVVPKSKLFDERTNKFIEVKETKLRLEHSLISISLWESKWKRCWLEEPPKTRDEIIDYIRCMCINKDFNDNVLFGISPKNIKEVFAYMNDPMSATKITPPKKKKAGRKEILTSEVIYGRMALYQIPFSCEKWHLNRLINLIEVCAANNSEPEKMSQAEVMKQNRELNKARRAARRSKG